MSRLRDIPIPFAGQPVIKWANMLRDSLRPLMGLCGDGQNIAVDHCPEGSRIRWIGDSAALRHFAVEQEDATSVRIRAGTARRLAMGDDLPIPLTVYPGWKAGAAAVAGDTSSSVDDYAVVSGITTTGWVGIAFTDSEGRSDCLSPDKLSAGWIASGAAYPSGDTDFTILPLALVTCADGVIVSIEQAVDGDWVSPFAQPDDSSVEYSPATINGSANPNVGRLQLYDYDSGYSNPAQPGESAVFPYIPGTTGEAEFPLPLDWATATGIFKAVDWDDADGFAAFLQWLLGQGGGQGMIPHDQLEFQDTSPGIAGTNADHDLQYLVKGAGWPEPGEEETNELVRNYCAVIGRTSDSQAIDLSNSQLLDSDEDATVDWDLLQLLKGDWSLPDGGLTAETLTASVGDITADAGNLVATLGDIEALAGGFQLDDSNNRWDQDGLDVDVDGAVSLHGTGTITLDPGDVSETINYKTTPGQGVLDGATLWFRCGGLVKSGCSIKRFADIGPDDKLLVG